MSTITHSLNTRSTIAWLFIAGASLLLGACTPTASAPNMVDYSYVPNSSAITIYAEPTIQDF